MKICQVGHTTDKEERFCTTCGGALAEACPNGHRLEADEAFCTTCGHPVAARSGVGPASIAAGQEYPPTTTMPATPLGAISEIPPATLTGVQLPPGHWQGSQPFASTPPPSGVAGPRPSLSPTILATVFLGIFGLIPAIRHSRAARERGYAPGRYWWAFGGIALSEAAISVTVTLLLITGAHSSGSNYVTNAGGTTASAVPAGSSGSVPSGAAGGSTSSVDSTPSTLVSPGSVYGSDWTTYSDPTTGFQISYPSDWLVHSGASGVFFRQLNNDAYMLIAYQTPAGPSALAAWQQQEQSFENDHQNYKRLQMVGGNQQATWEYTYDNTGITKHGIDDGMVVDGGQYGFALNWVSDESDWQSLQPVFAHMALTFVPPGG